MSAHVALQPSPRPPRSQREQAIRALARENPTVAACIGLVDHNGHPWGDALETLVLELARINRDLTDELTRRLYQASAVTVVASTAPALPDRDDDGLALCCGEVDCRCKGGVA